MPKIFNENGIIDKMDFSIKRQCRSNSRVDKLDVDKPAVDKQAVDKLAVDKLPNFPILAVETKFLDIN